jgi:hypothetical protein
MNMFKPILLLDLPYPALPGAPKIKRSIRAAAGCRLPAGTAHVRTYVQFLKLIQWIV